MKSFFSLIVLFLLSYQLGICQDKKQLDVLNLITKENSTSANDNENHIYSYSIAIEHTGIYTKNFIETVVFRFRIFYNNEEVYSKIKSLPVNLFPGDIDWFTIYVGKTFPFFVACDNCTKTVIEFLYSY